MRRRLRAGRVGGGLVMGGVALLLVGYGLMALGVGGGNVVAGSAMALAISGTAILSVTGPRPVGGSGIRLGLGALASGMGGLLGASVVASTLAFDPLESIPVVVLYLAGILGLAFGSLVTAASLLRSPGPRRTVGGLLAAVPVLFVAAGLVGSRAVDAPLLSVISAACAILGVIGLVGGIASLGLLVLRADVHPAASAAVDGTNPGHVGRPGRSG